MFRISGYRPELWDALTGNIKEAKAFTQKDGVTTIPLVFEPYGSVIIVFNKPIDKNENGIDTRNYPDYESIMTLNGAWLLHFDTVWGGPETIEFPHLSDWSEHPDERIKYYSGPAVYHKMFDVDFDIEKDKSYYLQLESVKDVGIATVKINGEDKGVTWTKPFRVDITENIKKGKNKVEIKVINSWYNRVAGDEMNPDKRQYTKTNIVLGHDFTGKPLNEIPLEPSGLIGPVMIVVEK